MLLLILCHNQQIFVALIILLKLLCFDKSNDGIVVLRE